MKKLTIAVGLLLGGITANAQMAMYSNTGSTEYVELSSSKLFSKSFMSCYNDDLSYNDLEVLSIKGNKNVHYVIYKGVLTHKVVIIGSDKEGSTRTICVNDECDTYDTHATQYEFFIKEKTKFTFSNTL